jgi:hypothetical protein
MLALLTGNLLYVGPMLRCIIGQEWKRVWTLV